MSTASVVILCLSYIVMAGITVGVWWGYQTNWKFSHSYWEDDAAWGSVPVAIFWPVVMVFFAIYGIAHLVAYPFAKYAQKKEEEQLRIELDNRPKCY